MSFTFVRKLPTPDEIREQYPVPAHLAAKKAERDAEIRDVLTGRSDKLLVIIGLFRRQRGRSLRLYQPARKTQRQSIRPAHPYPKDIYK